MRLSSKGLKVLAALLSSPRTPLCGSDLYRMTGVGAGTIYPMLARFEAAGWLQSEWEAIDPKEEGRPKKRLYSLTGVGVKAAQEELSVFGGVRDFGGDPCPA